MEITCFEPVSLALQRRSQGCPGALLFYAVDDSTAMFLQTDDASSPPLPSCAHPTHGYTPSPLAAANGHPNCPWDTMATPPAETLAVSLFLCTLRQWHALVREIPQASGAIGAGALRYCPFPPLLTAVARVEGCDTFAEVLALPAWQLWILRDYFLGYARAVLPELVADELAGNRMNFVVAKAVHDGWAVPGMARAAVLRRLTMEELAVLERSLFTEDLLSRFNITPSEAFCPVTTENAIVLIEVGPDNFLCNVVETGGASGHIFSPAVPRLSPGVASKNRKAYAGEQIASGEVVRGLDLACSLPADNHDRRITQLDVIIVDCSGSMSTLAFADDPDMSRSDAAQILFNMLVDKYRSMEINARVACVLFGSTVMLACPFTEDLVQFETLLGRAEDMGQTKLWDAVARGIEAILAERAALAAKDALSAVCRSRIIAVTDGLDNASVCRMVQIARHCRNNAVALDAFVLGMVDDTDLRICAAATGGHTLAFRGIEDATELFEKPFVVNTGLRPWGELPPLGPTRDSLAPYANLNAYPRINSNTARLVPVVHSAPANNHSVPSVAPSAPANSQLPAAPAPSRADGSACERRLLTELRAIESAAKDIGLVALDRSDLNRLKLILKGPASTLYENSYIAVDLAIPPDYPFKPPKFSFLDKLFHPQILSGNICEDTFSSQWTPSLNIKEGISVVLKKLIDPDVSSATNSWACSLYTTDKALYEAQVRLTLPALTEAAARARSQSWTDCP